MAFQRSQLIFVEFICFEREPLYVQLNRYLKELSLDPKTRHSEEKHSQSLKHSHNEIINVALLCMEPNFPLRLNTDIILTVFVSW